MDLTDFLIIFSFASKKSDVAYSVSDNSFYGHNGYGSYRGKIYRFYFAMLPEDGAKYKNKLEDKQEQKAAAPVSKPNPTAVSAPPGPPIPSCPPDAPGAPRLPCPPGLPHLLFLF